MKYNIIEQFIANGDGIYFLYSDHVNCDAAYLYVIKDGKKIHEEHPNCYLFYNYFKSYDPVGIIPSLRKLIAEHQDLKVFAADKGWYTFPQKWVETDYLKTLKKYSIEAIKVKINIPIKK